MFFCLFLIKLGNLLVIGLFALTPVVAEFLEKEHEATEVSDELSDDVHSHRTELYEESEALNGDQRPAKDILLFNQWISVSKPKQVVHCNYRSGDV